MRVREGDISSLPIFSQAVQGGGVSGDDAPFPVLWPSSLGSHARQPSGKASTVGISPTYEKIPLSLILCLFPSLPPPSVALALPRHHCPHHLNVQFPYPL